MIEEKRRKFAFLVVKFTGLIKELTRDRIIRLYSDGPPFLQLLSPLCSFAPTNIYWYKISGFHNNLSEGGHNNFSISDDYHQCRAYANDT